MITNHHITALLASESVADPHREAERRQSARAEPKAARITCHLRGRWSAKRAVSPDGYGNSLEPLAGVGDGLDRPPERPNSNPGRASRPKLDRVVARRRVHLPITAHGVARLGDYYGQDGQR